MWLLTATTAHAQVSAETGAVLPAYVMSEPGFAWLARIDEFKRVWRLGMRATDVH